MQAPLGGTFDTPLAALENGDIPGISGVVIDGELRALRSRNTPAAVRPAVIVEGALRT
jgi:enamidase